MSFEDYDTMWDLVMKAVPKVDGSESGQMVLKWVKWAQNWESSQIFGLEEGGLQLDCISEPSVEGNDMACEICKAWICGIRWVICTSELHIIEFEWPF